MCKGSFKNFFLAKTTRRLPKIVTLAVSSCLLVALVNIDASASTVGGRDSNSVRSDVVWKLASEPINSQFSGLVKRWTTVSTTSPTTSPVTTTTTSVASSSPQPPGDMAGPWNLVFDSEFNGSSLDASQWSKEWFGSGITTGADWSIEQECMDPAEVSVINGALDLTAVAKRKTCGGITHPCASGIVTTIVSSHTHATLLDCY